MGNSSERNWDARKSVPRHDVDGSASWPQQIESNHSNGYTPVEGLSPNCTICRRLTPVAGKLE